MSPEYPARKSYTGKVVQDDVVYEATLVRDDPERGSVKTSEEEEVAVLVPWLKTRCQTLVLCITIIALVIVIILWSVLR